ncbi:MAG: hypothetical protein ACOYNI_08145 [Acidimicrobiia bacterium]
MKDEYGQATAEYALVILVAAAVAGAALVWVTRGGLDGIFRFVTDHVLGGFE